MIVFSCILCWLYSLLLFHFILNESECFHKNNKKNLYLGEGSNQRIIKVNDYKQPKKKSKKKMTQDARVAKFSYIITNQNIIPDNFHDRESEC